MTNLQIVLLVIILIGLLILFLLSSLKRKEKRFIIVFYDDSIDGLDPNRKLGIKFKTYEEAENWGKKTISGKHWVEEE